MKRILTAIFVIAMLCTLSLTCFAEGVSDVNGAETEEFDFKSYLTEKIIPIAAGVATSLIALGGAIAKIKGTISTLNNSSGALNDVKTAVSGTLENVKGELKSGLSEIEEKIKDVPELKEAFYTLETEYKKLMEQNAALMEALKIGFGSIPDAVKNGSARQIAIISDKLKEVTKDEEEE